MPLMTCQSAAGNVSTLFLLEDQAIASMGLGGLSYSVGGGTDETDAQTLTYSIDGLPEAALGTVFLADGKPRSPQEMGSHSSTARP